MLNLRPGKTSAVLERASADGLNAARHDYVVEIRASHKRLVAYSRETRRQHKRLQLRAVSHGAVADSNNIILLTVVADRGGNGEIARVGTLGVSDYFNVARRVVGCLIVDTIYLKLRRLAYRCQSEAGSEEEAESADESSLITYTENESGQSVFEVPVEALDKEIECAALSAKKGEAVSPSASPT